MTRPGGTAAAAEQDTLSLQVDELRLWVETPRRRGATQSWAAAAGELLLNCGAIEHLLDRLLVHYAGLPTDAEIFRRPWPFRRAYLAEAVRRREASLPRRAALLDTLRKLDVPFESRTRLMHGRPRVVCTHSGPRLDDLEDGHLEYERWTGSRFEDFRLEHTALASHAEISRDLLATVEQIWSETPVQHR